MPTITDSYQKVGENTATTLSAPGFASGGTSATVASTTNWPTDTLVTCAIDSVTTVAGEEVQTAGTYTEYEGIVASGTSITNMTLVAGTAQSYTAGASTRVYIPLSSNVQNSLVDGILIHSDQDGTLKAGSVDNAGVLASDVVTTAKILDANVTTAKLADASVTNAKLATGAGEPGGAWTTWTPTFTNMSGGTLTYAKYTQVGKTVSFRFKYILAGAGVTNDIVYTLPVSANSDYVDNNTESVGTCSFRDSGTALHVGFNSILSATTASLRYQNAAATSLTSQSISTTLPFTWASTDEVYAEGSYEAA